ncbi:hypothetical protein BHE74_00033605 [Ensete ventricosum]|nr:hypothetical protein BHE74_00033605 [Ensete ventricosum]
MHHRDVDAPMASRCPGRRRQQLLRRTTELPPSCHPISCPALQGPPHVAISAYLARVIPGRFRKKKVYARPLEMSSRRSSRITDEEISELISKLQSLLPESRRRSMSRVSNPAAITPLRQSLLSATICDCLPHVASVFDAWAHICMQASAAKLLKETCSYIKSLHREVDDLSDRLSDLMSSMDSGSPQADIIRSILRS